MLRAALFLGPVLALPALAAAAETTPQIFKCTDGSGNVTYQNEPCPKNAKAGRIEIFDNRWTANKDEREAEWRRSAGEHRLVTGMPARWVREALGEPTEVRETPTAGAAQLWLYSLPDRSVQVGMLNDQVLWFRETPVSAPPSARVAPPPASDQADQRPAAPPVPLSAPANRAPADLPLTRLIPNAADRAAPEVSQVAPSGADSIRPPADSTRPATSAQSAPTEPAAAAKPARAVARGQDCKQALADLGPPSRQREVPATDAGSDPATEYFYESSSDAGRLRIVCSNGKVEGVDRSVAR